MLLPLLNNLEMFGFRKGAYGLTIRSGPRRKHRKDETVRQDIETLFAKLDAPTGKVVREIVRPHIQEESIVEWKTLSKDLAALKKLRALLRDMEDEEAILLLL